MRCGFCGREFDPAESEQACGACPVIAGCHLVRCPHCGYEMPPESQLSKWVRGFKSRRARAALGISTHAGNSQQEE